MRNRKNLNSNRVGRIQRIRSKKLSHKYRWTGFRVEAQAFRPRESALLPCRALAPATARKIYEMRPASTLRHLEVLAVGVRSSLRTENWQLGTEWSGRADLNLSRFAGVSEPSAAREAGACRRNPERSEGSL